MLSFGRGSGVSFRAGEESMPPVKAETAIASLSLFPRSKITEMKEKCQVFVECHVFIRIMQCVVILIST